MQHLTLDGPCLQCELRHLGCHDRCKDYRAWVDNVHEVKFCMKEERKVDWYCCRHAARFVDGALKKDCNGKSLQGGRKNR